MEIGVIDADIIGRRKHRFPNLASMKISSYHKQNNNNVTLLTSYDDIGEYDKVYISKVFTDTYVPDYVLTLNNVEYGGTGFFYDKAQPLPYNIEHITPDYHLYDKWIDESIRGGVKPHHFKYYTDYSIGFLTRGCFRQCEFCVNKSYKQCVPHSHLSEFLAPDRKKICLLDDNFLACGKWRELFDELQSCGQRLQFKQGLDERLLTDEKVQRLANLKYDGEYIFAFDDINDYDLIVSKLKILRKYIKKQCKFYVLCGYDRKNKYDITFWKQDLVDTFKRIELLGHYKCLPYIMRHSNYENSPYRGIYIAIAMWCNTPSMFKTQSLETFAYKYDTYVKRKSKILEYYELSNTIDELQPYIHRTFFNQ